MQGPIKSKRPSNSQSGGENWPVTSREDKAEGKLETGEHIRHHIETIHGTHKNIEDEYVTGCTTESLSISLERTAALL